MGKRGWIATNLPENERSQLPRLGQKENKINKKTTDECLKIITECRKTSGCPVGPKLVVIPRRKGGPAKTPQLQLPIVEAPGPATWDPPI